jgi:hypothetical protein
MQADGDKRQQGKRTTGVTWIQFMRVVVRDRTRG